MDGESEREEITTKEIIRQTRTIADAVRNKHKQHLSSSWSSKEILRNCLCLSKYQPRQHRHAQVLKYRLAHIFACAIIAARKERSIN